MPIGEIVGEGLGWLLRVVGQFVLEVFIELPVRATGYALLRLLGRERAFDSDAVLWAGIAFWVPVILGGFWLLVVYKQQAAATG